MTAPLFVSGVARRGARTDQNCKGNLMKLKPSIAAASVLAALCAVSTASFAATGKPDPYLDGARMGKVDPFTDGARVGKTDPYTDGARIGKPDPYTDGARIGKPDPYTDGA